MSADEFVRLEALERRAERIEEELRKISAILDRVREHLLADEDDGK